MFILKFYYFKMLQLIKLSVLLPYDSSLKLPGIYPREVKTCLHKSLFIKAYFTIATTWKQSRCPPVNEWINKLVHPDNGILFSITKKMSYTVITRHGGTLNAYYRVKEANLKRLHTEWFQPYEICLWKI